MNKLLTNEELFLEIKLCKETGEPSEKLICMFSQLCTKFVNRKKFDSFNEDWKAQMQEHLLKSLKRHWKGFNTEKSTKPIAYFTMCMGCEYTHTMYGL